MRLAEFLFADPGVPPQPDHGTSDMLPFGGEQGMETRNEHPSEYGYGGGTGTAYLDGQPITHLQGYSQGQAMRYRHMLGEAKQFTVKDKAGNKLPVEIEHDKDAGDYVAVLRGGRYRRMASGNERQPIRDHATGATPEAAVKALSKKLRESVSGHSVQTLDEVLKKGVQSHSAGDDRAIKSLTDGKYPAKAEDGKGFCFQWADGRGTTAFKWRNDALRWAKAEPRDIVKFWYGEPVHSNGKFRIRVTDRYRKEEEATGVETFSDLLERRRVS